MPTIITPFFGDQPFWGERVRSLGAGPAPIPQRELTPIRLAQALTEATQSSALRGQAAQLGHLIRTEDGLGRAAEEIEAYGAQLGRG